MVMSRKQGSTNSKDSKDEQAVRDQEVLRANKELAAYFKGTRTEREARAALKIIKAFVRDRERMSPNDRRPLPGAPAAPAPRHSAKRAGRKPRPKKVEA